VPVLDGKPVFDDQPSKRNSFPYGRLENQSKLENHIPAPYPNQILHILAKRNSSVFDLGEAPDNETRQRCEFSGTF
jgi:hypothetical protein